MLGLVATAASRMSQHCAQHFLSYTQESLTLQQRSYHLDGIRKEHLHCTASQVASINALQHTRATQIQCSLGIMSRTRLIRANGLLPGVTARSWLTYHGVCAGYCCRRSELDSARRRTGQRQGHVCYHSSIVPLLTVWSFQSLFPSPG
jgi:hypothetical protein